MFVDTHMHEMTCSKDSFLKIRTDGGNCQGERSWRNLHHRP